MTQKETNDALLKFGKYVIQQSKSNLTKGKRNVTKRLYDSLEIQQEAEKGKLSLTFLMEDYGEHLDKGVQGKLSTEKAPNSPFRFGTNVNVTVAEIRKWVGARRFQFTDRKTKRFMSYDETARLITRSLFLTGTKPTDFFSKPLEIAFERLPDDLAEATGIDLENNFKYSLE